MAYTDPQSVTINAIARTLPRTSNGVDAGQFTESGNLLKLSVAHSYPKNRARRTIRLDLKKIAADPLVTTQNVAFTMAAYLVVDVPRDTGFTIAEQKQLVDGLTAYLTASTGARVTQLLGGEN